MNLTIRYKTPYARGNHLNLAPPPDPARIIALSHYFRGHPFADRMCRFSQRFGSFMVLLKHSSSKYQSIKR